MAPAMTTFSIISSYGPCHDYFLNHLIPRLLSWLLSQSFYPLSLSWLLFQSSHPMAPVMATFSIISSYGPCHGYFFHHLISRRLSWLLSQSSHPKALVMATFSILVSYSSSRLLSLFIVTLLQYVIMYLITAVDKEQDAAFCIGSVLICQP